MAKFNPKKNHYTCAKCKRRFEGEGYYAGDLNTYCKPCALEVARIKNKINKIYAKDFIEEKTNKKINFHHHTLREISDKLFAFKAFKNESINSKKQLLDWLIELRVLRQIIDNIKYTVGKYNG